MGRKSKHHYHNLPLFLEEYGERGTMYYQQYSEYHMRLSDDYTTLDVWTSGHYWVGRTDYVEQTKARIVERGGEKGDFTFNPDSKKALFDWLDKLFYAADMAEGVK